MAIAVTGGVAEGKSTVLAMLSELGYSTYSADQAARQIFLDLSVNLQLARSVGQSGPIEPAVLREKIFSNAIFRRRVNAIAHPLVMDLVLSSHHDFVEVPLLYEVCAQHLFRQVWVISCGPEMQLERLTARMGSREVAKSIISSQLPTQVKIDLADRVIRTNWDLETVRRGISMALQADSR
jgi:dephospho-CoA kinase